MNIVGINEVILSYCNRVIFNKVSLEIAKDDRVGIIGKNGQGKTTLIKLLSGEVLPDYGEVFINKNINIGILEQKHSVNKYTKVINIINESFVEVIKLNKEMKRLEKAMESGDFSEDTINKYGRLQEIFEIKGGYEIENNIKRVCKGLKITEEMQQKEFRFLSEGEKSRVILANLLLLQPDLLILDEPTNHLDVESIEWLEEFVKEYKGTILIISHDRVFLDNTINKIIEIENGKLNTFKGNYTNYYEQKELILSQREKENQLKLQKSRKILTRAETLSKWGSKGDVKDFHDASKKLKIEAREIKSQIMASKSKEIKGGFKNFSFSSQEVIKLDNVSKSYGSKMLFENLSFIIMKDERVSIEGKNGSGKSTLLKGIVNEVNFNKGNIKLAESARYAYLPQVIEFSDENLSMLELINDELNFDKKEAISLLIKYNFEKNDWEKKVRSLSGGERSRLKLAIIMQKEVNLLILDEPTNHLDIFSREWLEKQIEKFKGTVIFVSHDRYFINKFATRRIKI